MGIHLYSRTEKMRQFYRANVDTYLLDSEVAKAVDGPLHSVSIFRHQQMRKGRVMECITVGNSHAYRFTSRINKTVAGGLFCKDPKYTPCPSELFDSIKRLTDPAGKRYETAVLIEKLNDDYWTDADLAKAAKVSLNVATARRIRLVRDFNLKEHIRGFANKRERLILPWDLRVKTTERIVNWDYMPTPSRAKYEVTEINSLLNRVLS